MKRQNEPPTRKTGNYIVSKLADLYESKLIYFNSLSSEHSKLMDSDRNQTMAVLQRLWYLTNTQYPQETLGPDLDARFGMYFKQAPPQNR